MVGIIKGTVFHLHLGKLGVIFRGGEQGGQLFQRSNVFLAADGGNSAPHQTQMQVLFKAVAVLLQGFRTVRVFPVTYNAFLQHQVVFFTQLGHGGGSIMNNLHILIHPSLLQKFDIF